MTDGLHHYYKQRHKPSPRQDSLKPMIDLFIYFGGIVGPLVTLPQLIKIWYEGTAQGVSAISWCGYLIGAAFWLAYGIIHREKPIIFTYGIWVILDILIILGVFLYG